MLSHGGVERVPQDARGAAAAHDLRARHDRGEQGAADGRRPLPPLRLRAARRVAADRRRCCAASPTPRRSRSPTRRSRWSPARPPARSATRSARSSSCVAYSGATIALDDVLAVLGAADADLLFGAVDAVAAGDARAALLAAARLADSGRDVGRFFGDLEAHARGADGRADARRGARRAARHAEQDERLRRAGRAASAPADVVAAARPDRRRAARDEGRRRRPHPARARARQGRRAGARPVARRRCWRGSSGSRRARPAPAPAAAPRGRAAASPPRPPAAPRVAVAAQVEGQPPVAATPTLPAPPRPRRPSAPPTRPRRRRGRARDGRRPGARGRPPSPSSSPTRRRRAELAAVELSLDAFAELWPAVLDEPAERVADARRACSQSARPAALADGELTLAWPESAAFSKRKAEDPANRELIAAGDPRGHRHARCGSPTSCATTPRSPPRPAAPHAVRGRAGRALHGRVRRRGASPPSRGADLMPQPPNLQKMLAAGPGDASRSSRRPRRRSRTSASRPRAGGGMVKVVDDRRPAPRVAHDRPRRGRPRGRRDAAGHGRRRGQRGAAQGRGAAADKLGGAGARRLRPDERARRARRAGRPRRRRRRRRCRAAAARRRRPQPRGAAPKRKR